MWLIEPIAIMCVGMGELFAMVNENWYPKWWGMPLGSVFGADKRRRNLAEGYEETKGLKDGHCNRSGCQAPLIGRPQAYMRDHETNVDGARLYYCGRCADMFNRHDREMGLGVRCTFVR